MPKTPKEPLFESLEEDKAKLEELTKGESENASSTEDGEARSRVNSRRSSRKSGASSPDNSKASQEDGGASRGSRGDTSGSGDAAQDDDGAPSGDDKASQSGAGDGVLDTKSEEKPLTPAQEAYNRRINREMEAENKRLKAELEAAKKPAESAKAAPEIKEEPSQETYEQWLKNNPKPDRDKDLAGYLVWNAERIERKEAHDSAESTKRQKETDFENLKARGYQEIIDGEGEYKKTNPDYDAAMKHAMVSYLKSAKTYNPNKSDRELAQELRDEVVKIAARAHASGQNLYEVLYDTAIERFGYQPNQNTQTTQAKTPSTNLRVVASNKRRSASPLSSGGGEGAKPSITLEQLADMSIAERLNMDASDWEYANAQGWL